MVAEKLIGTHQRAPTLQVEVEFLRGLRPFVLEELSRLLPGKHARNTLRSQDSLTLFVKSLAPLLRLRTAVALHLVHSFDVPRPRALLGESNLSQITASLENFSELTGKEIPDTFRISAAGKSSSTYQRLASAIEQRVGIRFDDEDGRLLIRVRPSRYFSGWDLLIRMTNPPLSTRPWRVHNLHGALNATIAAAMVRWLAPNESDRFLNLTCGSATLIAERSAIGESRFLVGVDRNPYSLELARENLRAANARAALICADVRSLPLPERTFTKLCADPPWGSALSSREEIELMYPRLLNEAARAATNGALMTIITHQLRLFDRVLMENAFWREEKSVQVFQKGHNPRIYLLKRKNRA